MLPDINDLQRAERLLFVLSDLSRLNERIPIIVEGKKDINALRRLGLKGEIVCINSGEGLYEFCERIHELYRDIIMLTDWDKKGESLFMSLTAELSGLWEPYAGIRESLKSICQKDVKDVESIPTLLYRLYGREITIDEYEEQQRLKGQR
ncbi:MAG: hypothetical protein N3A62_09485 [Thermodesulfovibrionales bacterium]|nr:hypothetical protein [Thermodesulfovibrionales bacterium]